MQASPGVPSTVSDVVHFPPVPRWAQPGRVRFARWDGGALETAKGLLSGWYYLSDPLAIETTTNWYQDSRSIDLLADAGINCIWVTFTNGFSLATERPQQQQLHGFISRCHERGIRVIAYASMVNVFIQDVRANEPGCEAWLQRTAAGATVPYGAARYTGVPARLLACLNHPAWRDYLVERVRRACEAGADGMSYDNHWTQCRCPRCEEKWTRFQARFPPVPPGKLLPWPDDASAAELPADEQARLVCVYHRYLLSEFEEIFALTRETACSLRPDFLLLGNFNSGYCTFTLPPNNAVSTEDGREPGLIDGHAIHNIGLLRSLAGATAGRRPVFVEYGAERDMGRLARTIDSAGVGATRFVPMRPAKHQLSIAEAAAHGVALEVTPEGLFLRDLSLRSPQAMANWEAIAGYNRFLRSHEELYCGVRTATGILSIHSSGFPRFHAAGYPQRLELLRELATRRVLFDVAFVDDLTPELLARYRVLLLADVWVIDADTLAVIRPYLESGGQCIATGTTGCFDAEFRKRPANALSGLPGVQWMPEPSRRKQNAPPAVRQTNIMDHYDSSPEEDLDPVVMNALAGALESAAPSPVRVAAPPAVLFNATLDARGRLIVHLLNYDARSVDRLTVSSVAVGPFRRVEWFTPDPGSSRAALQDAATIRVEGLLRYGVLRLTPRMVAR